jgi:uncharacterized protein
MDSNPHKPSGPLAEFTSRPSFQLAIPALELATLRVFYVDVLGSKIEREDSDSLELSFFGGSLRAFRVESMPVLVTGRRGGKAIPVPHFGLVMSWEDWHRAVDHLNYVGITYRMPPTTLITPEGSTEAWFAIADPSGNCLAFSAAK